MYRPINLFESIEFIEYKKIFSELKVVGCRYTSMIVSFQYIYLSSGWKYIRKH